ncbi:hypothetical protein DEO72_LG6g1246 [Vigna unguiculata]|uniref:Uncharacterized protein n=1 Tax=Vigna unguiculata TaxID=3917 RepID=A0A4D6M783_VIGUN|nr:hypothetical protein DEO72_LG6g1246 [Vigna unguiculata]
MVAVTSHGGGDFAHGDDDFAHGDGTSHGGSGFARWRQVRTVTMGVGKWERQNNQLRWKRRAMLRKRNYRKKWEMGNILCRLQGQRV